MKTWLGILFCAWAVMATARPGNPGGPGGFPGGPGGPGGGPGGAGNYEQSLRNIENSLRDLRYSAPYIPGYAKRDVIYRLDRAQDDMDRIIRDLDHGGGKFEGWLQVNGPITSCFDFCRDNGMQAANSREGAACVSGENRAASAVGVINFKYGCWPNCSGETVSQTMSIDQYCYKPGQKQDNNQTDITVGCYCR